MTFLLLAGGLVFLVAGGELLVKGSVDTARRLGLPPLLIGIVIVGFGTSMPEFMVSLDAALRGAPGLAVGNVFGSNTSNTLLILGLGALLFTFKRPAQYIVRDAGILMAVTIGIVILGFQGMLPRWQGGILFAILLGLTVWEYWRCEKTAACPLPGESLSASSPGQLQSPLLSVVFLAAGFGGLFYGADLFVDGAIALAHAIGVTETFIGLTVAAVGTSLPELFVTLVATRRGQSEMAFGNIIGSNLFNILGVLGFTALITPLEMPRLLVLIDGPVMVVAAALMFWLLFRHSQLSRLHGAIMVATYVLYVAFRYVFTQA